MAENNDVIVNVRINTGDVAKKIGEATNELRRLKDEQKALDAQLKYGQISQEEYGKQISAVKADIEAQTRALKSNTAVLQAVNADVKTTSDSLDEQRQYLNTLQKAYANLSGEQKEMADTDGGLRDQIKEVSDSLKEQEAAIGDNRRNVGNYAESITNAFGEMAHAGELMSPAIGLLRQMGPDGKNAANALDALQKTMQLVGKAGKVIAASRQAEQVATQGATVAQNGLNVAMSANPIGLIVAGLSTLLPLIQTFIGAIGDASKEQEKFNAELERQNKLIEQAQKDVELEAELAEIQGATKQEAINLRRKQAQEAEKDATEEYQRLLDISVNGSRKERKAAKEALDEAEQQMKDAQKRVDDLNKQATLQEARDRKSAEDKRKQDAQKRKETRVQEAKDEQAALDEMRNELRRRQQTDLENELEDLRAKMDKELGIEGLSEEEKQQINEYYAQLKEQKQKEYNDKELEEQKKHDEEMLAELAQKYADEQLAEENEFNRKLLNIQEGDTVALAQAELEQAQAENDALVQMDEETKRALFKTQNEYEAAIIASEKRVSDAKKKVVQEQRAMALANAQAIARAMGSLSDLLGQFAEEDKQMAKASKAIALGKIAIETGIAIAGGVAQAQSVPFPANLVAIATTIATVLANMASAISTVKEAKFATGGIVGGTSYTGDQVPVRLNSGEMVLNREQQSNLFDAVSNNNGTLGIDYEMMAKAMESVPAPVMAYSEFKEFEQDTTTYEELAKV